MAHRFLHILSAEYKMGEAAFPLTIQPKHLNAGTSNANHPYCTALTHFHGQLKIAYGSSNRVVVVSSSLSIIATLERHDPESTVTAVAWAPFSGRLTSAATDNKIIVWEPDDNGWNFSFEVHFNGSHPLDCLSWSMCDHIFCTCSDEFSIYHMSRADETHQKTLGKVFVDQIPTSFCSHSKDSRFILTIPKLTKEVILFHKREKSATDYAKIHLVHPSLVMAARWRTSDQLHERCCFMTIAEDHVVRIWSETSVNESLKFDVVAAVPAKHHIIAANFISTTSRMVSNNPLVKTQRNNRSDTYAYGHGHFPIRDKDIRSATAVDETELNRNHFWLVTIDTDQRMIIWEMSGTSSNVRRTPTISQYTYPIKLGVSTSEINQINAFCRLESEYSHLTDKKFIGKPRYLSLIIQNKSTKVITSVDISLDKKLKVTNILHIHGHNSTIKSIHVHHTIPYMVSLDVNGNPIIWKYNDTDVYDPSVLVHFFCQLDIKLKQIVWLIHAIQFLGFDGSKLILIDMPKNPSPLEKPKYKELKSSFDLPSDLFDFNVVCELSGGYIFYALSSKALDIMWIYGEYVYSLKHVSCESEYVDSSCAYVTRLLPYVGASICFYATKHDVYIAFLTSTEKFNLKNASNMIGIEKCLTIDDEIKSLCISHPGYIFIACSNTIYVSWRVGVDTHECKVLHKVSIDYIPQKIRCIATGLVSVTSKDGIHLYYPVRNSQTYLHSNAQTQEIAFYKTEGVSAIDWTLDGILLYGQNNQIFAFTKFMDTFFLNVGNVKLPTIHHFLAFHASMVSDFHPSNLIPIAISGKINLLLYMLDFLNTRYSDPICRWYYTDFILHMKDELKKTFTGNIKRMLNELHEKIEKDPISGFSSDDISHLLMFLENLPKVLSIPPESLDTRGIAVARAIALNPNKMIPFDLINLAYMSQDQTKLMEIIDFTSWDSIRNSGIFFWATDLSLLTNHLVKFSISAFEKSKYLSIILLTITQKFVILKTLFKKAGDDTRAQFFLRDFSTQKQKRSAERNGYSALSKQDYHIASAMFYLADRIDLAVRIIEENLHDIALAYLICKFYDHNTSFKKNATLSFINEIIMPLAIKSNDDAALDFFERQIDSTKSCDLTKRYQNSLSGNMNKNSNFFCDCRFVSCEILMTTIEQKADLSICYMHSGHYFLSTLLLIYFDVFNLKVTEEEIAKSNSSLNLAGKITRSISNEFKYNQLRSSSQMPIQSNADKKVLEAMNSDMTDDGVDNEIIDDTENAHGFEIKSLDLKMTNNLSDESNQDEISEVDSFSFGGADIDDFSFTEYNSEEEEENNAPLPPREPSLLHPSPSMMLGEEPTLPDGALSNSRHPVRYSLNVLKSDQQERLQIQQQTSQASLHSFALIPNAILTQADTNSPLIQPNSDLSSGLLENQKGDASTFGFDALKDSALCDFEEEEAYEELYETSTFNWFIIVVVFNIARNRLDAYLETQHEFHKFDSMVANVSTEINSSGLHLQSMHDQLTNYLIRSCKRKCFIFRRLLLLSKDEEKKKYILDLCKFLARLPDQILAFKLTNQQTAQIIQTVKCLIRFINQKAINFDSQNSFKFIVSSISIAIYAIALFYHDIKLMSALLKLDLNTLNTFPEEIENSLEAQILDPKDSPYNFSTNEDVKNMSFTFITQEKADTFKDSCVPYFVISLTDFMIIDTLFRNISSIQAKKYLWGLTTFVKKLFDAYFQFFSYTTLNFPNLSKYLSLENIKSNTDKGLNSFIGDLLNQYDRKTVIPLFCKSIIARFSLRDSTPENKITYQSNAKLHKPTIVKSLKDSIRDFCMNKDFTKLFLATHSGIETVNISKSMPKETSIEDGPSLIQEVDDNNNANTDESSQGEQDVQEEVDMMNDQDIDEDFSPKIIFQDQDLVSSQTAGKFSYLCVARHPTEDYALFGDVNGNVLLRSLTQSDKSYSFKTQSKRSCNYLAFSEDGTMFASANGSNVELWSLLLDQNREKPFTVIDTYSKEVVAVEFATGTGFVITGQIPSQKYKISIAFWDVLMNNSMISSANLKEYGAITSLSYSSRYSTVFIGTSKGIICSIDTRKFSVVNKWKFSEKKHTHVSAMCLDDNQSYIATGSSSGSLKLWDIQTSNLIGELNNVHKTKSFRVHGKLKEFGITSISCHDDIIFTGGVDGTIRRILFAP